jgi:hypothetical protein
VSTVYRTLGLLEEIGVVRHIHLSHGPAIYERTAVSSDIRHLVCESCGRHVAVPRRVSDTARRTLERDYDFVLRRMPLRSSAAADRAPTLPDPSVGRSTCHRRSMAAAVGMPPRPDLGDRQGRRSHRYWHGLAQRIAGSQPPGRAVERVAGTRRVSHRHAAATRVVPS